MSSRHRDLDEDDVRSRPSRNKSRPRSKDRPHHDDAILGMVTTVDRGRFTVMINEGTDDEHTLFAIKARELGRKGVLVGDRVGVVGDLAGGPDSLARLVTVHPRTSLLRRTARSFISIGIIFSMHRSAISLTASATSNANVLISDSGKLGTKLNSFAPAGFVYLTVAIFNTVPLLFFPDFNISQYKLYASSTACSTIVE